MDGTLHLDESILEQGFALVTVLDGLFKIEFSKPVSRQRMASHILYMGMPWIRSQKEKGILSPSKKEIVYADIRTGGKPDRRKTEWICDFFRSRKIRVLYNFQDTPEELHEDLDSFLKEYLGDVEEDEKEKYTLLLNAYGNVDACSGLPAGWHVTDLTVTQIRKCEIPFYKACTGFKESGYSRIPATPILKNIIPDDFSGREQEYLHMLQEKKEQKQEKVDSLELTMNLIAECIYSVNKEAKRKRDIQEDCIDRAYRHGGFYEAVHYRLHRAKHEKASLYDLKERALEKAVRIWGLKPEGYHIFPDQPRDMYVIAGYSFHANKQTAENCIGMIGEEIPAERKRCIPPAKAILVLQRFIKE